MTLDKTPDSIVAEIKLLNTSGRKSFLLVEGRFDYNFWRNKKHSGDIEIIDCQGRKNVEAVVFANDAKKLASILGVTDKDYDYFFPPQIRHHNLVSTDYNDLETTILSIGVASDLLRNLCDLGKLNADSIFLDRPETIFRDALDVGRLRFISKQNNYDFPFQKKFSMGKYYDTDYKFNYSNLINDFSQYTGMNMADLYNTISSVPQMPLWHVIRGHDCLLNLYNIIQRYKFTSFKPFSIEIHIQCMFKDNMLQTTSLYNDIRKWETASGCCMIA